MTSHASGVRDERARPFVDMSAESYPQNTHCQGDRPAAGAASYAASAQLPSGERAGS